MLGKLVHEDSRGQVYIHTLGSQDYGVTVNKKGAMRGGDYHPIVQYNLILKGQMKITQHIDGEDVSKIVGPNELAILQPKIPHLLEALIDDTVMVEWWEGDPQSKEYEPYRNQVKQSIARLSEE